MADHLLCAVPGCGLAVRPAALSVLPELLQYPEVHSQDDGLDAYVSYLESLVNVAHQKTLFRWQSYLIYANGFSFGGTVLQLPCYFAILVFIIYKFVTSMETLDLSPLLAAIICMVFVRRADRGTAVHVLSHHDPVRLCKGAVRKDSPHV